MSVIVVKLDDHRRLPSDARSPRKVYRAGEVVRWQGVPWESLVHGNASRPEVVVEGHLYYSSDWAPVWDKLAPDQTLST